jgi:transposase-like protein
MSHDIVTSLIEKGETIMRYSPERKEAVVKKMVPPHSRTIPQLSREEGISEATLYTWRKEARAKGVLLPGGESSPEGWTTKDKFAAVVETASLNEAERGEYCRKRGIYPEQITAWRQACEEANDWDRTQNKRLQVQRHNDRKQIKTLEKELRRKERALAETAALLVLRKKAAAIWGEPEGE